MQEKTHYQTISIHCTMLLMSVLVLCGLTSPAKALPPTLRGIDMGTVLMMRDQARATAIQERLRTTHQGSPTALKHVKTIVLDAGHGGENQGALGVACVHEKFLTIDLAFALRDAIQERYPDARIIMTRYWDRELSLSDRITMANERGADLFLSLHYNAAVHDKAIGVETYFLTTEQAIPGAEPAQGAPIASASGISGMERAALGAQLPPGTFNDAMLTLQRDLARSVQHQRSGLLAELIQTRMVAATHSVNRGVKQANFGVLRGALMPAVVVEAGFVTHPAEGKKVATDRHRARLTAALLDAIIAYDDALAAAP